MPTIEHDGLTVDFTEHGQGPVVVLVHSSVSSNRQWRKLAATLQDAYRVLAVNLFGYGQSTVWPVGAQQTLFAQAQLVRILTRDLPGPIHLVGHSFGGSVAMKFSTLYRADVASLSLFEPNPFFLLRAHQRHDAYRQACELRDHVQCYAALHAWDRVAERLCDGSWDTMPANRKAGFLAALPPNLHEWDALMNEQTTVQVWGTLNMPVQVISDPQTWRPIREIVDVLKQACPDWTFRDISGAGHMAPLTRPDLANPLVRNFLDVQTS